jgi:hypothetical protein
VGRRAKTSEEASTQVINIKRVPKSLMKLVRGKCGLNGLHIRDVILDYLRKWVSEVPSDNGK